MKNLNFKKLFNRRHAAFLLLVFGSIFLVGHSVSADFGDWAGNVVGGIIALFIRAISSILILIVEVLMSVATYSDFIRADAVSKGWVVVRDLCNMFFVVILLIIAFATILGQEEYGAKKMLPKLVMAAVLINFSKLICGLMIDVSNVVMLTFVNAFSTIGAANILDLLGISEVTKIAASSDSSAVSFGMIVSSYIFGLIYVIIATVVVAAMLGMLVIRLVMIWILVVLSPFAFFLQAVPGGGKYSSMWWNKWTSNLLIGPVIAFFLWLSFASLQNNPIQAASSSADLAANNANIEGASASGLGTEAATPAAMAKFVIAIGMLLGGMSIAQSLGAEAGSALGKGMSYLNKGKALAIGATTAVAAGSAKAVGRGGLYLASQAKSFKSDPITGKHKDTAVSAFASSWYGDLTKDRKKERNAKREKYLKSIGMGEKTAEKGLDLVNKEGTQLLGLSTKVGALGSASGVVGASMVGASMGSIMGPAGAVIGAATGSVIGTVAGYASRKKHQKVVKRRDAYKNGPQKTLDDTEISNVETQLAANPNYTPSTTEAEAIKRRRQYNKDNSFVDRNVNSAFKRTKGAFTNMTEKKKRTEDRVKVMSNTPDYFKGLGKGGIYKNNGITDEQKRWLDSMNSGEVGSDGQKALQNLVNQVIGANPATRVNDDEALEIAKLLAAYKKDDKNSIKGLSALDNAVTGRGHNTNSLKDNVLIDYKDFDKNKMSLNRGSGALQYDTFAKNSAKDLASRKDSKDIMGVSFAKVNQRAKDLGVDYSLDDAAGANQKVSGESLDNLSKVMGSLIDDEIKSLQAIGDEISTQRISQLETAKSRLNYGDISGLSLKNTDVSYESRQDEYNTTQHELMHQAGAKNEELVNDSAGALQEAKLIGQIPGSNGDRYDAAIGKLIASMEKSQANPDTIRAAIDEQITKWLPSSNATRVIELEDDKRDTVSDVLAAGPSALDSKELEKVAEKFDKTLDKLSNQLGGKIEPGVKSPDMSVNDKNFFMRTFNSVKKSLKSSDKVIGDKLKPLSALAMKQEKVKD